MKSRKRKSSNEFATGRVIPDDFMTTKQQLHRYKDALKAYRAIWSDYRRAYQSWFRRGGREGGGGAWDFVEREYLKAPEPVKPICVRPTPQEFGLTNDLDLRLAAEIEKKAMK